MLTYPLLAFAAAAVLGLFMAARILRDRMAPWSLSLIHGGFGALGLVLLIAVLVGESSSQPLLIAFGLLVVAALGGFFLASFHVRKRLPPTSVVIIHAGVAVAGFGLIVLQAL